MDVAIRDVSECQAREIKRFIRLELDQTQSKVVRTVRGGRECESASGGQERNGNPEAKEMSDSGSV